eukprot:350980-Chlamydomonas_euryale.AAC.3
MTERGEAFVGSNNPLVVRSAARPVVSRDAARRNRGVARGPWHGAAHSGSPHTHSAHGSPAPHRRICATPSPHMHALGALTSLPRSLLQGGFKEASRLQGSKEAPRIQGGSKEAPCSQAAQRCMAGASCCPEDCQCVCPGDCQCVCPGDCQCVCPGDCQYVCPGDCQCVCPGD